MTALYSAGDEVVLRVAVHGEGDWPWWRERLTRAGVRVPQAARPEPLVVDGLTVSALERIVPSGRVDWHEVGAMVRRVHALVETDGADLLGRLPWAGGFAHWDIGAVMAEVQAHIDDDALEGMMACLLRWQGWRDRLANDPQVACHGDVHPGNVLPTAEGVVLIDWDLRCRAPIGWDHCALMTWAERWDGEAGMYEAFAEGYGRSLRTERTAMALAELRLLVATLMRVRAGLHDERAADEAENRLRWWRGDPDAPRWTPQ